ncbi:Methyltransferase domain-containing protein [Halogranum amylolyticum]|uniref:Methyltransferase domain-containing protein n=1 Tax=Halogranum amylolyticum TaxID=660520 RepID=A0A1H8THZ6_9EURY|nr:class I SAM-dependent methyltransferase [Halogranum amylolyticum]SEO90455.1 Methyltransferase domain-containing protein [Halogranum amylolyticum]
MGNDRRRWNERYRDADFSLPTTPTPLLSEWIDQIPDGRALDVATGTGRNARFLADHGYNVDAVDISDEALRQAREHAARQSLTVNWVQADLETYPLPTERYDVIVVTFFHALDLLPDLKEALAPGGFLLYEHHLRADPPAERGPSDDRHRFRSNDLLRACLDLTVLHYEEATRVTDGRRSAVATLVARNSTGGTQAYPHQ